MSVPRSNSAINFTSSSNLKCIRCAKCCHCFSITFTPEDINREPRLLDFVISIHKVFGKVKQFMVEKGHPFLLRKQGRGSPCPFLLNSLCMIYNTRPQICRDYPQGVKCLQSDL
jgi:Fe-S-cluster containining protein